MKKKDVIIEIKGCYHQGEDEDELDFLTDGKYYQDHGNYVISYDESEMTGLAGCRTTLTVEGDRCVTLNRTGSSKSQLIIERGVRHQCYYDTGYGAMTIGVCGDRIASTLDDSGGTLEFAYSLDVNTSLASENELWISVKPANPMNNEIGREKS